MSPTMIGEEENMSMSLLFSHKHRLPLRGPSATNPHLQRCQQAYHWEAAHDKLIETLKTSLSFEV